MTRRHHRRLLRKGRQLGQLFAAADSPTASDPSILGGSSASNAASQSPSTSDSNANNAGKGDSGNGNGGNNPIGGNTPDTPSNPDQVPQSPSANSPSQPTQSIPATDPFPPAGANRPQQQSAASPSPTSSAPPSRTSAATSSSNSSAASSPISNSASSSSVSAPTATSLTQSSPSVVAAPVHTVASSSTPFGFSSLNPTQTSLFGSQSTISALLPSPTNTSHASSTSSISTPAIVGIAAGGLCGLAILAAACLWIGKRVSRYMETRELEPPPMHELVADEDPAVISRRMSGPSSAPRPPTMIERRQANLAGRGNGFYNDNNGYNPQNNFPPYATDPRFGNATPFAPGQYYPGAAPVPVPTPAPQAYFSPIASPSPFDDSAAAIPSAPGTPVYFSRQNSVQSGFSAVAPNNINIDAEPQLPNPYDAPVTRTNDGYATLNRGPSTPQRRYTDLSHQLSFSSPNDRTASPAPSAGSYAPLVPNNTGAASMPRSPSFKAVPMSPSVVNVPSDLHEGRATPVQFGFTTPAATGGPVPSVLTPASGSTSNSNAHTFAPPGIPASQSASSQASRPETVYDEEDAYAAI